MGDRILIAEPIADAGIGLLAQHYEVDVAIGLEPEALRDRIVDASALIVRSATPVDAALIAAAPHLRVIGRAGGRAHHQRRPRRHRGRSRPRRGRGIGARRRRSNRCVHHRADDREPVVRVGQSRGDSAPGCVDPGGPGQGRSVRGGGSQGGLEGRAGRYCGESRRCPSTGRGTALPPTGRAARNDLQDLLPGAAEDADGRGFRQDCAVPGWRVCTRALKGAFQGLTAGPVTYVNAGAIAETHGVKVREAATEELDDYQSLIQLTGEVDGKLRSLSGTVMARRGLVLTEVDGCQIEFPLTRYMLLIRNEDVPGVLGLVGTLLGNAGVNIANLSVGREHEKGGAMMGISLDKQVPPGFVDDLLTRPGIAVAQFIELG